MAQRPEVVVITGAGGGIGRSLAIQFARDGAFVLAFGRNPTSLEETARAVPGGRITCVAGSVTSEADVERLVAEAIREHGRIDVLINNAAVYPKAMLADGSPSDWLDVLQTNVVGPLICYRKVLPGMLEKGYGRIINMGSFAGQSPLAGSSAYGISKVALRSLSKSMAAEIDRARHPNVLVNELVPGSIRTGMSEFGEDPTSVYPHVVSLINLPAGGPTGRIFIKDEIFHENSGIKARLKRKLAGMLGRKID